MFQCTDDEGEFGVVYDNMTGDGVMGAVVERRADFGASSIDAWYWQQIMIFKVVDFFFQIRVIKTKDLFHCRYHEFQFLDFASPLTRTGVTCLCPKPV